MPTFINDPILIRFYTFIRSLFYLSKDEMRGPNNSLGEFVVSKYAEPYLGCWQNITTDRLDHQP